MNDSCKLIHQLLTLTTYLSDQYYRKNETFKTLDKQVNEILSSIFQHSIKKIIGFYGFL